MKCHFVPKQNMLKSYGNPFNDAESRNNVKSQFEWKNDFASVIVRENLVICVRSKNIPKNSKIEHSLFVFGREAQILTHSRIGTGEYALCS